MRQMLALKTGKSVATVTASDCASGPVLAMNRIVMWPGMRSVYVVASDITLCLYACPTALPEKVIALLVTEIKGRLLDLCASVGSCSTMRISDSSSSGRNLAVPAGAVANRL